MAPVAPEALLTAIRRRDQVTIELMLRENPSLARYRGPSGESLVLHACYVGAPELAPLLLRGRSCNAWEAAALGQLEALRTAVENDDDARGRRSGDGWTPLHLAAFFGRAEAVALLIDLGAPLEAHSTNETRNTPLHAALAGAANPVIVRRLVFAGADVQARGAHGVTPLHLAASRGDPTLCELLLHRGADVDARMEDGSTPAMLAIARGHAELGEKLAGMTDRKEEDST